MLTKNGCALHSHRCVPRYRCRADGDGGCYRCSQAGGVYHQFWDDSFSPFPDLDPTISSHSDLFVQRPRLHPKHVLWAYVLMKVYNKERANRSHVATNERNAPSGKTFRGYSWDVIAAVGALVAEVVSILISCFPCM